MRTVAFEKRAMLPSLALVISLGLCQAILADQTKPPRSARLVSPIQTQIEDEVVNDVTQAKPYWIKPETMLRTVFAEHLGSKVRKRRKLARHLPTTFVHTNL